MSDRRLANGLIALCLTLAAADRAAAQGDYDTPPAGRAHAEPGAAKETEAGAPRTPPPEPPRKATPAAPLVSPAPPAATPSPSPAPVSPAEAAKPGAPTEPAHADGSPAAGVPPATAAKHSSRPPAKAAPVPLPALPAPAHTKDLDASPGAVGPAEPVPAPPQKELCAIVGATVHTVSGGTLAPGTVVFASGRIVAVGTSVEVPAGARRIDGAGLHVYPSLIAGDTTLGLVEIGAVRATRDVTEVGELNPNARAEVAVNPDSELLPVARSNGVLVAVTAPHGGLVSGTGAVIGLDGWTWEDMTLKAPAGLWIEWPAMTVDRSPGAKVPVEKQERDRDLKLEAIKEAFATAKAYARGQAAGPAKDRDVKWEAMTRAVRGEIPVVVRADDVLQIKAAVKLAEDIGLSLVIAGGRDAVKVADTLRTRDVTVLVGNVFDVGRAWEPYDEAFTTPARLHDAGVRFCITYASDMNVRNLPYVAAKAVAYGLSPEVALESITLAPARVFGVADRLGSIEPGKDATLIVTDGDVLDERTNVRRAFLGGRELDLTDRHKRLYERHRLKPRRSAAARP